MDHKVKKTTSSLKITTTLETASGSVCYRKRMWTSKSPQMALFKQKVNKQKENWSVIMKDQAGDTGFKGILLPCSYIGYWPENRFVRR